MGSFANSVHVRCDVAQDVVAAIESAMRDAGYETTNEKPDEAAAWGMPSPLRAMHVSAAHNGWVGVLDSDLLGSVELASNLSRRLATHSIQFMVNDSDSWAYQLCRDGELLDEFDSSGEMFDEDDGEDDDAGDSLADLAEMASPGAIAALQEDLMQRMRDWQQQLVNEMPAPIRAIQERMQQGRATQEEVRQYGEWAQSRSQQMMAEVNELVSGIMPPGAAQSIPPLGGRSISPDDLHPHLEHLRPLLRPGTDDGRVLQTLGKQTLFAEETLGEFLPLVGIQPYFANLSYRYLEESSPAELRGAAIEMVAHLKFRQ